MTEAVEPEGLAQNFPNAWDVGVTQSGLARDYQNHGLQEHEGFPPWWVIGEM